MEIPRLRGVIGGPARSPPDDQEYNDDWHEGEINDDDGYKDRLDKHENDKMYVKNNHQSSEVTC